MNNFIKKELEKKTTYKEMVEFCTDNLILNNEIIGKYNEIFCNLEIYCGSDYDEENDNYIDVFQYYIIDEQGAERFAEYTNELVYFLPEIDLYLLGVTHYGTSWAGVPANWNLEK